jgi:acetylglutamate kinase
LSTQQQDTMTVIKYGGNAMTNPELQQSVMQQIAELHAGGNQ